MSYESNWKCNPIPSQEQGDCVIRSISDCFDIPYKKVKSQIRSSIDVETVITGLGYSRISLKERQPWTLPGDDLDYPHLMTILDTIYIDEYKFLIHGFDIPSHCESFPDHYRHHLMHYNKGVLRDDDYDDPFLLQNLYIDSNQSESLVKLISKTHKSITAKVG